jgi:hypothetical protein
VTKYILFLTIGIISILFFSCADDAVSNEDLAVLRGVVYFVENNSAPEPLAGAIVSAKNYFVQDVTDNNGVFEIKIELTGEEESIQVALEVSKAGYESNSANVDALKGESIIVPDITLTKLYSDTTIIDTSIVDTTGLSGDAAHISVDGNHPSHIYVLSSGLQETAQINFLVTDSQGRPVDSTHQVTVFFEILNGPGGGEYLEPDTMTTNNGKVFTVLNSGIIAGPVQLDVYADVDGQTIRSLPVRIAIYGGLPDLNHFSVAVDRLNIAGRVHFGILDNVTAFVGDKFSNPVAPGTIVYFSTDYCVVEGAAVTNDLGQATVRFESAGPLPPNPADSTFAHITAWTLEDPLLEDVISTRTRVLLSDVTAPIQISPTSFQYNETNTPIQFDYVVSDIWGNPLVGDTRVRVQSTDGSVYGDTDLDLVDSQTPGPGRTNFQFYWAPGDSLESPQVYITVKVTPPEDGNGYQSVGVSGTRNW